MIYFDNAATTKKKPTEVLDAFNYYVNEIGVSPGRGSYQLGIEASRMLYKTRSNVADYFGLVDPNVVFSKNSTEAINLFLHGFLKDGDHVLISPYEHNAVLRPLETLKQAGVIDYTILKRDDLLLNPDELLEKYIQPNTVLMMITLASNLTGRILFDTDLFKCAKQRGIETFIDASQGAGKIRINMPNDCVDYLAFTGHKDIRALPGVGGLCSAKPLQFEPLIQGGTGILGHEKINPHVFPEGYEAGTLNMPAIWALNAAIDYVKRNFDKNKKRSYEMTQYLIARMSELSNVTIYDKNCERVDTVGFNVVGVPSNDIVYYLDQHGICTRGGIHCAILAHEALGTTQTGVVRVSLCEYNTNEEIDELISLLQKLGE